MRNKEKFVEDFNKVVKPEIVEEVDPVQDAAHAMNQRKEPSYTVAKEFTTTGKDETFKFKVAPRPKTDNPDEEIDDYFYEGRGE